MPALGELFVALGFDVDDKKLKDFNQGLQSTLDTALKLAGVSLSLDGFKNLMGNAGDAAVKLNQMTLELGLNQTAVQRWALAVNQTNPLISVDQAKANYASFAALLERQVSIGQGPTGALAMLGVSNLQGGPEGVRKQIAAYHDEFFRRNTGPDALGRYTGYLNDVGLGAGSIGVSGMSEERIDEITKGLLISQEANKNLSDLSQSTAKLGQAFNKLTTDFAADHAKWYNDRIRGATGILEAIDQGSMGPIREANAIASPGIMDRLATHLIKEYKKESQPGGFDKEYAENYFMREMSLSANQAQGLVHRLYDESGLDPTNDPRKHGRTENAWGLAQWQVPRQKDFYKKYGFDIHKSTFDQQLDFIAYELTKGNERAAGEKLKNAKSESEAYDVAKNSYERPAVTQNITQNIHSSAPLKETLDAAADSNKQQYNSVLVTLPSYGTR